MKIFDNRGVTLIELLITLTIVAILFPVMYGVLISGMKVYENITIDAKLREEADYVSSMIVNTLYANPFDTVEPCKNKENCLSFLSTTSLSGTSYGDNSEYTDITRKDANESGFPIEVAEPTSSIDINGSPVSLQAKYSGSTIELTSCNGEAITDPRTIDSCTEGVIQLRLVVQSKQNDHSVELVSQFGF
ncbi:type IV pilus modification PilV family protein [Mangrovibacillus cuniculi]|uniref:Prepilin-type N-terminal cleavage/methylation domain-containing protein n=1 Tax=Mangrovibacillus cuniculi TaxID=2593652 RepID=A0A7S8CBQ9_9BACI|nr:prepilin-type N-terminal cleavage/methylation domain-containing protein [Mangrovibacillus cuniculi]QPC47065.1 prepilin-type N-terminal cleavage/methylation domain-containing protein [Mangrovibacillus cuniculi]